MNQVGVAGAVVFAMVACAACGGPVLGSKPLKPDSNRAATGRAAQAPTSAAVTAGSAAVDAASVWSELTPPPELGLAGLQITSASAAEPDDFFFAASFPGDAPAEPAQADAKIVRWQNGLWSSELTATAPGGTHAQVAAAAPDDVWAELGTALYHRDAQRWVPADDSWRSLPAVSAASGPVLPTGPLRATGRDDAWVMASGILLHYGAGSWSAVPVPVDASALGLNSYSDLWIAGPNDIWLGGQTNTTDGGPTTTSALLLHFDGTTFTHYDVGLGNVDALWRADAGTLWLATPGNVTTGPVTLYRFSSVESERGFASIDAWPPTFAVHSLWGRAPDDVWAAGDDVAHWDGTTWSRSPSAPDGARATAGTGRAIVIGDDHSVWLIARGPRFFRLAAPVR